MPMAGLPGYVAYFLLLVGPLVLFHELGHFAVAKWCGVKVTRFSFGFGPRLLGFRRGETEYRLSLLPLGGYVKMAGDNPAEPLAEEDKGRGFLEAPPWKRMVIALAGPAMNLILPVIVFFVTALAFEHQGVAPYVGAVLPDSPAEHAGMQAGDVIESVDGKPVRAFEDIRDAVGDRVGVPLAVVVRRDGRDVTLSMTPTSTEEQDEIETTHRGMVGIRSLAPPATIGVLDPTSPAYLAGLRTFDRIVSIDGKPVDDGLDLERFLAASPAAAKPADVVALRSRALGYAGLGPGLLQAVHAHLALGAKAGLELDDLYVRWVLPGSPAEKAGIHVGDRVRALDGKPLASWWGLEEALKKVAKKPLTLTVEAPGQPTRVVPMTMATMDLGESQVTGERIHVLTLGLLHDGEPLLPSDRALPRDWIFPQPRLVTLHVTVGEAMTDSVTGTVEISRKELLGLMRMFQGRISVKQLGGPLMIADVARQAAQEGAAAFLFMMTLLSINLGLLNLVPLPALDGGHVATALVEAVRRKPLSMRAREVTQAFGLVLLMALMAFVIINDFVQKRGPSLFP
jgi:regulator of sigma E protease